MTFITELPVATCSGCELNGIIYVLGCAPARFLAFDTSTGTWDESLPNHPLGSQASAMAAHNYKRCFRLRLGGRVV